MITQGNKFYGSRRKIAGRRVSTLRSFQAGIHGDGDDKVYVSELLTPFQKRLFGIVNRMRKKLEWKYIWTQNGRVYLKQSESSRSCTFDSERDVANFEKKFALPPTNLKRTKIMATDKLSNHNI